VFIDMASIPPKVAQEHAAWLKERGIGHLDAPVSGGSLGAAEGSLAIMAGGERVTNRDPSRRAAGHGSSTSVPGQSRSLSDVHSWSA
jgi:2-hydroxy-3-oxopropionate reductase